MVPTDQATNESRSSASLRLIGHGILIDLSFDRGDQTANVGRDTSEMHRLEDVLTFVAEQRVEEPVDFDLMGAATKLHWPELISSIKTNEFNERLKEYTSQRMMKYLQELGLETVEAQFKKKRRFLGP